MRNLIALGLIILAVISFIKCEEDIISKPQCSIDTTKICWYDCNDSVPFSGEWDFKYAKYYYNESEKVQYFYKGFKVNNSFPEVNLKITKDHKYEIYYHFIIERNSGNYYTLEKKETGIFYFTEFTKRLCRECYEEYINSCGKVSYKSILAVQAIDGIIEFIPESGLSLSAYFYWNNHGEFDRCYGEFRLNYIKESYGDIMIQFKVVPKLRTTGGHR